MTALAFAPDCRAHRRRRRDGRRRHCCARGGRARAHDRAARCGRDVVGIRARRQPARRRRMPSGAITLVRRPSRRRRRHRAHIGRSRSAGSSSAPTAARCSLRRTRGCTRSPRRRRSRRRTASSFVWPASSTALAADLRHCRALRRSRDGRCARVGRHRSRGSVERRRGGRGSARRARLVGGFRAAA